MAMARSEAQLARWRQLDQWLDELLALPPEARSDYLQALRERDAEAAAELSALLAAGEGGESPLDRRPAVRLDPSFGRTHRPGEQIGRYRLQRLLGSGGMGEVWLAQSSADAPWVAIKLIRTHLSSRVLSERLARERDILKRLRHPGIAALLDSGLSEEGEPFLVLEYVEGQALLEAAAQRGWDLAQKLRVFAAIADAVAAAQSHLIVHRDLKPANILIDAAGRPKLLDFGIAKLLDDSGVGASTELTLNLGRALTPAYAAPEQMRGEPVSTATDVYALGVVLHELLLGLRPQRSDPAAPIQSPAQRARRERGDRQLAQQLRGDLEVLLRKALAPDAADRYPNADALAADIHAWLEQRPLRAQPDAWHYRLRKLVRRHRVASAALLAAVLALLIGGGLAWQRSVVAELAAARAERAAARAEYVQDFMESLFANDLPGMAREDLPTTAELLSRGAERALTETAAEPGARLNLLLSLARIQVGQRMWQAAEASLTAALALAPSVADLPAWRVAAIEAELASTRTQLAPGDRQRGIDALDAAYRRAEALGAPADWRMGALQQLIAAEVDLNLGDSARAHAAELIRMLGEHPDLSPALRLSALTQASVAHSYDQQYRAEAEELAIQALQVARQAFGEVHAEAAYAGMRLAAVLRIKGDVPAARPHAQRAAELARQVYPDTHPQRARILEELARVQMRQGEIAEGIALWQEVLAARVAHYGESSFAAARTRSFLAAALLRADRLDEAASQASRAMADLGREVPPSHALLLDATGYAAQALLRLERTAEARALLPAVSAPPPADLAPAQRWRFFDLQLSRVQSEEPAAQPGLLAELVARISIEQAGARDMASVMLTAATMALRMNQAATARLALDAAAVRIAQDDSTHLSEVLALLEVIAAGQGADREALRVARDRVVARRSTRHESVRLADAVLGADR